MVDRLDSLLFIVVCTFVLVKSQNNAIGGVRKSCTKQADCSDGLTCIRRTCVDPCSFCGPNTECRVKNHRAECNCKRWYKGDPLAGCIENCGTPLDPSQLEKELIGPLVTGGQPTVYGEYPWLTALYIKDESGHWNQACGGTLISSKLVLTAGHCLKSNIGTVIQPQDIQVGLGKYFRDYYTPEKFAFIAEVKRVSVPKNYVGSATNYGLDIGILELKDKVELNAFVMPACFDWNLKFNMTSGEIGYIAGWGSTSENNITPSDEVLKAELSYLDNVECVLKLLPKFKKYVTHDKFCARSTNGGQVKRGDSGGGLTVIRDGKHFVVGVVSLGTSDDNTYSLFSDLHNFEHHLWLEHQSPRVEVMSAKSSYE